MSWALIVTENPLPSTGVKSVFAAADGSFIATVQNATTEEVNCYFLNPSNLKKGWEKMEGLAVNSGSFVMPSSQMPFAFGQNGFGTDTIALPDAKYFETTYKKDYPFYETIIYAGNLIKYTAANPATNAFYHIHVWPVTDTTLGSFVDASDERFPSFQFSPVFYAFVGNPINPWEAGHCFYVASALETKSDRYFSLVISYGRVNVGTAYSPVYDFTATIVADPIAPAEEVIVGIAAPSMWQTSRGYVAVAADGTSYFAAP